MGFRGYWVKERARGAFIVCFKRPVQCAQTHRKDRFFKLRCIEDSHFERTQHEDTTSLYAA